MANPPSLGDGQALNLKLVFEQTPLPKTRSELLITVSRILEKGLVQKLVIQLNQPIKYERLVPRGMEELGDIPIELKESLELFDIVRNAEMSELDSTNLPASPYACLFRAFHVVSTRLLIPKVLMFRSAEVLTEWLQTDSRMFRKLYGIDFSFHPEIPRDVALLAAASPEDEDSIVFSVRFGLSVKPEEIDEAHSEESSRERSS